MSTWTATTQSGTTYQFTTIDDRTTLTRMPGGDAFALSKDGIDLPVAAVSIPRLGSRLRMVLDLHDSDVLTARVSTPVTALSGHVPTNEPARSHLTPA